MANYLPLLPEELTQAWADGAHMRRWLHDEKIIVGSLLLPTSEACEKLASQARFLRMIVKGRKGDWLQDEKRRVLCLNAITTLIHELPSWERNIQVMVDIARETGFEDDKGVCMDQMLLQDLAALRSLSKAAEVANAREHLFQSSAFTLFEQIDVWHDFAKKLSKAFAKAVRSSNPTLELRISNTGPIVRFLVAAIPHITGENPTSAAVARYLQRSQR